MPRLLDLLKPAISYMPEVTKSKRRIEMKDKMIWTGVTLFIYLICS
jgi:protein transport protein SEC61 subunit alpha